MYTLINCCSHQYFHRFLSSQHRLHRQIWWWSLLWVVLMSLFVIMRVYYVFLNVRSCGFAYIHILINLSTGHLADGMISASFKLGESLQVAGSYWVSFFPGVNVVVIPDFFNCWCFMESVSWNQCLALVIQCGDSELCSDDCDEYYSVHKCCFSWLCPMKQIHMGCSSLFFMVKTKVYVSMCCNHSQSPCEILNLLVCMCIWFWTDFAYCS